MRRKKRDMYIQPCVILLSKQILAGRSQVTALVLLGMRFRSLGIHLGHRVIAVGGSSMRGCGCSSADHMMCVRVVVAVAVVAAIVVAGLEVATRCKRFEVVSRWTSCKPATCSLLWFADTFLRQHILMTISHRNRRCRQSLLMSVRGSKLNKRACL